MFANNKRSLEIKTPDQKISSGSALIIYEDKLVVLNFHQQFAVVIKSAEVAETVGLMYNMVWDKI